MFFCFFLVTTKYVPLQMIIIGHFDCLGCKISKPNFFLSALFVYIYLPSRGLGNNFPEIYIHFHVDNGGVRKKFQISQNSHQGKDIGDKAVVSENFSPKQY